MYGSVLLPQSHASRPNNRDRNIFKRVEAEATPRHLNISADVGLSRIEKVSISLNKDDFPTVLRLMMEIDREKTLAAFAEAVLKLYPTTLER